MYKAEDHIVKEDKILQLKKTSQFCPLNAIADSVGWRKLWDLALDRGSSGIKSVKNLVRIISYPNHASTKCPKCDIAELDPLSLPAHIIEEHTVVQTVKAHEALSSTPWSAWIPHFSVMCCLLNVF